ncbi:MAG: Fur family transcriptional regulator [Candidatus Bruticola sp.]
MNKVVRRGTKQRKVICQVVQDADRPLSPQEILQVAQKHLPNLGIATVYRSVKYLTEEGVFKTVELPGEGMRYEISGKHHHHHFHCKACGKVYEIDCCIGADTHNIPSGFSVDEHVVFLYGICADCSYGSKKKKNTLERNCCSI